MRKLSAILAAMVLASCADPQFQQYVAQRQAAISAMPNGQAKFYEQERLDMQVLEEKRLQQQRAAAIALGIAAGAAAAADGYNASRPVNVNVWHWR